VVGCHEDSCHGAVCTVVGESDGEVEFVPAWLAVAVPSAINAGAAASTAPAAIRRIQVVVLALISILLSALLSRFISRCVPLMYPLCLSVQPASVGRPAHTGDELDVLQLGDIPRVAVWPLSLSSRCWLGASWTRRRCFAAISRATQTTPNRCATGWCRLSGRSKK
jgi:hypothetical protein